MRMELKNAVVVITGASSGIGRATARRFARRGARLVLSARRADMLSDAVEECRRLGAEAFAVSGDVTSPAEMQLLADEAVRRFGRLDVWINNAGVMMFGRFEDTPSEDFQRVIDVNLFGVVNGTRAALPHMLRRNRGTIINTASIVGHLGQPYSTAYVTSKFAVRGFTVALRQELLDRPNIQVCAVLPSSTDTPLWQHTANYTGQQFRAFHPAYDPDVVARTMESVAEQPRREAVAGIMGKAMVFQHRFLPSLMERFMAWSSKKTVFKSEPAARDSGALWHPLPDGLKARGGWRVAPNHTGLYVMAALLAIPAAAIIFGRKRQRAGKYPVPARMEDVRPLALPETRAETGAYFHGAR
jgi:NAD(P)-dependent dehydrogenase (short-subunit alcohol dehydrogenase family)